MPKCFEAQPAVMRRFGALLLALGVPAAAYVFLDAVRTVLSGGYLALYQRHISGGVESLPGHLSLLLVPGALLLMAGHEGKRWARWTGLAILVIWSLANFTLGGRGLPGFVLLGAILCWHRSVRPLPKAPILLAGLAIFGLGFPLIAVVRNMAGEQRDQALQMALARGALDNPVVSLVGEMGTTLQTVAHTQRLVPSDRPFDMGQTYGYAALAVVPNVFWEVHPTKGRGVPSNWLVWTVFPEFAAIGGGLGFSFIAEAYLNFGWLGALLIMPLMGTGVAWVALRTRDRSRPLSVAMGACFMAFLLFYARADSTEIVRRQTWYVLIPAAACVILSRLSTQPRLLLEHKTAKVVPPPPAH